jgi:O-antigen ligase
VPRQARFLVFLLAATLAAFGGTYAWALLPILAGAIALTLLSLACHRAPAHDNRALDIAIAVALVAIAVQLIPLPSPIRLWLSPGIVAFESALRPDAALRGTAAGPLTLDTAATARALALALATALTYRAARVIFSTGGVRLVCGALGVIGAVYGVFAIVQRALAPTRIYGLWIPQDPGAQPFGPVVNRNHFAAWLLMASAVTAGYFIARVARRTDDGRGRRTVRQMLVTMSQTSVAWTGVTWLTITITIVAAQSRSAILGLTVAAVTLVRTLANAWLPVFVGLGGLALVAVVLLGVGESTTTRAAERFAGTLAASEVSRTTIWRETIPVIEDFALTGVGAGNYGRAMLMYQRTRPYADHLGSEFHFNHAHNHYLQLLAEGGLLVTGPFVLVVALFVGVVGRRLRDDTGELRAVRLGAVAGLTGVAVQSLWEVPLTMPAAALLAATLAALATYRRSAQI